MKTIFHKFLIGISLLVAFSACTNEQKGTAKPTPSAETIESVKSQVAQAQQYLPVEGGVGLLITDMNFNSSTNTINYTYQYTVPGVVKPSDSEIKEAKRIAVSTMKNMPREKEMIEQGITFHYDYFSNDGQFLYSTDISIDDL